MILHSAGPGLLLAAALAACAPAPPRAARGVRPEPVLPGTAAPSVSAVATAAAPRFESVLLPGVPHVRQKPDFCGEAAAEMFLRKLGQPIDQDLVFALSGMDPARGMGATTRELKTALERIGLRVGPVWHSVRADAAALRALFAELHADLRRGVPSIVCMHYDERPQSTEHFRLVLGYDAAQDEVVYHEPAEDDGAYRRMPLARFLQLWPLKYDAAAWTVIRLRLDPGELVPADTLRASAPARLAPASLAQHIMELREKLPVGFSVRLEPPFVVVGDGPPEQVEASARHTVRWAVDLLKRDFFRADPAYVIDVWLFRDDQSYRRGAQYFFGEQPSTPYGYYSHRHRALVMNIATGGGTLVHEIVHPFMEANFPACPAWLNEGLGSLYEQSSSRDGHIIGLTNWRLAGLQRAIREGKVPSFATLAATTSEQFYDQDPGTNYAQARYLCYYLQEQGLLVRYFGEVVAGHAADPTGYKTLQRVLAEPDMTAFQRKWERFVLGLRFP
ncbi:MAG: C39 family peptidase [Deltaproteobacteria bacterium]|nr:C39 family peptidase [Deltaproteobacteria bacterium]